MVKRRFPKVPAKSMSRWMLSLSPTERLLVIQQQVNAIQEMKEQIDSD